MVVVVATVVMMVMMTKVPNCCSYMQIYKAKRFINE
jgi:hypothetical protein